MAPAPEPDEVHYQEEQPDQRDHMDDLGDRFPRPVTGDDAGERPARLRPTRPGGARSAPRPKGA